MVLFFLFQLLALLSAGEASPEFYPKENALRILHSEFKNKDFAIEKIDWFDNSSGNITVRAGNVVVYSIKMNGNVSGFALFSQSKGRFDYFDYMILVSMAGKIEKVKVLKYISEHGGEIRSSKWLAQFIGYEGGPLIYGKDIQALTGATISAGSITSDIQILLGLMQSYLKDNQM